MRRCTMLMLVLLMFLFTGLGCASVRKALDDYIVAGVPGDPTTIGAQIVELINCLPGDSGVKSVVLSVLSSISSFLSGVFVARRQKKEV